MRTTRSHRLRVRAFTLVEMVVVLGIMSILAALAMSATTSLLDTSNLTSAGQILNGQIGVARQLASTLNQTVEVRLVQTTSGRAGFQGIQIWAPTNSSIGAYDATDVPLTRLVTIPNSTVIDTNTTLSPIFSLPLTTGTYPNTGRAANAAYSAFSIRPSGVVEPVPTQAQRSLLYFTIVSAHQASTATAPPDYITIQLNPDTANTLVYQP